MKQQAFEQGSSNRFNLFSFCDHDLGPSFYFAQIEALKTRFHYLLSMDLVAQQRAERVGQAIILLSGVRSNESSLRSESIDCKLRSRLFHEIVLRDFVRHSGWPLCRVAGSFRLVCLTLKDQRSRLGHLQFAEGPCDAPQQHNYATIRATRSCQSRQEVKVVRLMGVYAMYRTQLVVPMGRNGSFLLQMKIQLHNISSALA